MPLIRLTKGARYQFDNVLVQKGEVIEVDNRTRNRLVRSGHFIDCADHERPAFVEFDEDEDRPMKVQGGVNLDDIDDPAITGATPGGGPKGSNRRSGSEIANQRAAEAKVSATKPVAVQTEDAEAEKQEAAL